MATTDNYQDILNALGNDLVSNIRDKIKSTGASATGKSAASLRFEARPLRFTLYGSSSFNYIEVGRPSGGMPPLDNIKEWIKSKGLQPREGGTISGLAYAIATKIKNEGTQLYANNEVRDIYTNEVGEFTSKLKKEIGEKVRLKTSNEITRSIKI